jgi:short-subunit dehydrogenase
MSENRVGTALITGASSGIGAAFAHELAARGHDLILTGRRQDKIEAVAQEIRDAHPVEVEVVLAELSHQTEIEMLARRIAEADHLEVLINNAGFAERGPFHETDVAKHQQMLAVHCMATVTLTHAALPKMLERQSGTIINVSSLSAFTPLPGNTMYSATKSFINMFTESLHAELGGEGIRLQALCPGMTRTDFHVRMGLDPEQTYQDRGLMKATTPEEVVARSLDDLEKGHVVCLPGVNIKAIAFATRLLPRDALYRITAKSFSRK